MSTPAPQIPVICDRCRATGLAGEADFSHLGDLLQFEPVAVRQRVNGWDADAQRAFIALLATTGSKRRAALALGRNTHGIDQLLKRPDADGFRTAVDRAMAIAKANGAMKLATGVADAAARNAQLTPPSRLRDFESPGEDDSMGDEEKLSLLENLLAKFMRKVEQEREARLAGRICEADFNLRQITFMEVLFDLTSTRLGFEAHGLLRDLRRGGHDILHIASTPFAEMLDRLRRQHWEEQGDPPRPDHPDPRYLEHHGDGEEAVTTQTRQSSYGALSPPARGYTAEQWAAMNHAEQRTARETQFRQDAAEQVEWERSQRRAYEERRASDASS